MKPSLALLLVAFATGCATPAPEAAQEASVTRCSKEMPTGSNRIVTVCRDEEDSYRARQEAREVADRLGKPQGRTVGPGGP